MRRPPKSGKISHIELVRRTLPTPTLHVHRVLRPFQRFVQTESAGGVVLLACTAFALIWANSPWAATYFHLWETPVTVGAPGFGLTASLHHWINDGLMALFFFLVGLEIKREMLVGELASVRQSALPIAAAIGGMIAPAAIYGALNARGAGAPGWGIPMATDIAFALGVLALLGDRVPPALKVFLAALAIVDDLGAVLVIALFYTADIAWTSLGIAGGVFVLLMMLNRGGARHPVPYALLGIVLWLAFLESGIHATVAGVLLAMTIPARQRIHQEEFLATALESLDEFQRAGTTEREGITNPGQLEALQALDHARQDVRTPLMRFEEALHGWVAFGIMPLFALANAGVALGREAISHLTSPITIGVVFGLVVGKPVGITLASWLAVRTNAAVRPAGVSWRMLYAVGWLGGIGFTMSLFIASLAFADAAVLDRAKVGILGASVVAGIGGWIAIRSAGRTHIPPDELAS